MTLLQLARLALFGSVIALTTATGADAGPIVMKLGTGTLNDSQHEWMKIFAAIVDKDRNMVSFEPSLHSGFGTGVANCRKN